MEKAEIEIDSQDERQKFEEKCRSPRFVIECLKKYQRWRKGEGEYGYDEEYIVPHPIPFSPKALSIVEDSAIDMLEAYASQEGLYGREAPCCV